MPTEFINHILASKFFSSDKKAEIFRSIFNMLNIREVYFNTKLTFDSIDVNVNSFELNSLQRVNRSYTSRFYFMFMVVIELFAS